MLRELPTLYDINITVWQMSNQSCGVHIPRMDATGGRRCADTTSGSGKGKGKIALSGLASKVGSRSPSSDAKMSFEEIDPLERKRRLVHSDGFAVGGPSLSVQQATKKAVTPQPDPKAAVSMALSGSGDGRFVTSVKEDATAAVAIARKKVVEMTTAKEATTVKKATEAAAAKKAAEVATVKKAAEEVAIHEATEAATVKRATEEAAAKEAAEVAMMKKAAEEAAAHADAEKASDSTSALGVGTKRAATSMSGSSPPMK
jgi:hypothetical protein